MGNAGYYVIAASPKFPNLISMLNFSLEVQLILFFAATSSRMRGDWSPSTIRTYAEVSQTLTPSPSPKVGEGNKKLILLPFSRSGRRGWGMRAI